MAYCTVAYVSSLTGVTFSSTTPVTDTDVSEFIDDVTAEINAELRRQGFAVTSSTDLTDGDGYLKRLNGAGAAWYMYRALYSGEGQNASDQVDRFERDYERMMKRLRDDANAVLNTSGQSGIYTGGAPIDSSDTAEYPPRHFSISKKY